MNLYRSAIFPPFLTATVKNIFYINPVQTHTHANTLLKIKFHKIIPTLVLLTFSDISYREG